MNNTILKKTSAKLQNQTFSTIHTSAKTTTDLLMNTSFHVVVTLKFEDLFTQRRYLKMQFTTWSFCTETSLSNALLLHL